MPILLGAAGAALGHGALKKAATKRRQKKNTTKSPECSIRKHLCHRMGQEDGWVHNEWLYSHSCNGHYHLLRLVIYLKWHIEGICGSGYEYDGNLR